MPKIGNPRVLAVLTHPYFKHHVAMHLARERANLSGGQSEALILPAETCDDCLKMIQAGQPGSGQQFLEMHHEMIRVFKFLLDKQGVRLGADWKTDHWEPPPATACPKPDDCYNPTIWPLGDWKEMPVEIRAMFSLEDPKYLEQVFNGVQARIATPIKTGVIDELGKFLERGVPKGQKVQGEGSHNAIHEYTGSREGKAATGAEMNNLFNARNNDYFWSLHLWIDAWYGQMLAKLGNKGQFDDTPLDPARAMHMGVKKIKKMSVP